jgi:hypothetical protein
MRTRTWLIIALLVCGAAYLWSAQDTSITQREVRDPRKLEPWLEANASDAQTRMAALEAGTSIALASNKLFIGSDSGTAAAQTLSGDVVNNTNGVMAISAGAIVNADINAAAAIAVSKLATAGAGAAVATKTSVAETQADMVTTVISLTNVVLTATDGSDEGESQKILDFDAGAVSVILSVQNGTTVVSAGATNFYYLSVGTAAAGDDATLTGTEANVIPSTTIDTTSGTVLTNDFDAILAAAAIFDGTSTAIDLYLNMAIADTNMSANVTNTLTGTLTIVGPAPVNN